MLDLSGRTGIIWCRVSTDKQDKRNQIGGSKDEQLGQVLPAAQEKRIRIIKQFAITETATKYAERQEFDAMIEYVRQNNVGTILVKCSDRLSRAFRNVIVDIGDLIELHDVAVYVVESDLVVHKNSTPDEWRRWYEEAIHADIAGKRISKWTRDGLLNYARKGRYPGLPPNGYISVRDPDDPAREDERRKIIVTDPVRAPLIKWAFEAYAEGGWSDKTLRDELNAQGLRSGRGKFLSDYDVHIMLTNPFYAGWFRWKGLDGLQKGNHKSIVSQELWDRVQAQRKLNQCSWKSYIRKPKDGKPAPFFTFRPFLKCGHCGCSITAALITGTKYYRCSKGKATRPGPDGKLSNCPNHYHREDELSKKFDEALSELTISEPVAQRVRDWILRSSIEEEDRETKKRRSIENQIALKRAELGRQLEIVCQPNPILTVDEARPVVEKCREEIKELEAAERKLSERNYQFKDQGLEVLSLLHDFKKIYLNATPEHKAKILNVVLDQGLLYDTGKIEFRWSPVFQYLFDMAAIMKETNLSKSPSKRNEIWGR
jgi:DNA invertase Pin-like site-specific DNA recombinase